VRTGARVTRIRSARGRATGVELESGERVRAGTVVVAAGTLLTPGLLRRSGLTRSRWLGRNLSIHPATAVTGRFDEDVDMGRGVPQSYVVDEFAREGILLEGIAGPPGHLAMAVPHVGDRHRAAMLAYRRTGQFGVMVSDRSRGRVHAVGARPVVRYDLCDADVRALRHGLVRLAELFWAAGARTVTVPVAGCPDLHGGDSGPLERLPLRARDLKLMAFHPLGTARAHADPALGVLDPDLRVHGTPNVFVADGSAVPTALGVNPQVTIMALATRLAHHLLGTGVACRS